MRTVQVRRKKSKKRLAKNKVVKVFRIRLLPRTVPADTTRTADKAEVATPE